MGTSLLNLNQFTKGGAVSLLKSYNEDMSKIDAGISADRVRLSAAEQAIASLPTGGYAADKIYPLAVYCSWNSGRTLSNGCRIYAGTKLIKLIAIVKYAPASISPVTNCSLRLYDWSNNILTATDTFEIGTDWTLGTTHEFPIDYTFSDRKDCYSTFATGGTGSYNYFNLDILGIAE